MNNTPKKLILKNEIMKIVTKINNHILNKRINIINNRITKHEIIGEINKINNKKN